MRLRNTKIVILLLAGVMSCTSDAEVADIAHPTGADDVLIQIGDYTFGWPDEFLNGPEIVVYGDGRVFAEIPAPSGSDPAARRPITGELDDASIQTLLRAAEAVPANASTGEVGIDATPTLLVVGRHRWEIGERPSASLDELVNDVRDAVDSMPSGDWIPERWTVRLDRNDCTVSATPAFPSYLTAPVFPHLVGTDPFADIDCAGA